MDFEGKVLFATGGGSGIAAATAQEFAAGGGRVAIVDLDADKAQEVASGIDGAIGLGGDVADESSVVAAIEAARQQLGRIDCVLNAAGHAAFGPIEEWTLDSWNRMMAVHAGGTFLVCKHVLPIMREQGGGSIVNIASTAALTANHNNSPYGAAKGAIVSFSRQLAREGAPDDPGQLARARSGADRHDGAAVRRSRRHRRGGRQALRSGQHAATRGRTGRAGGADLLPALRRRQLHDRDAPRRRRR